MSDLLAAAPWLLGEVIEQAPVGIGLFDRDIRFVKVNRRLAEINGHSAEAHVGRRPEELLEGLDPAAYLPVVRRALAGEVTEAVELSGETPAAPGVQRHWLESWAPVRSPDGEVTGALVFVVETTERKRAESALHDRERSDRVRAEALAELAGEMAGAESAEILAERVAALAAPAVGADFSNLALLSEDGRSLRLYHGEVLDRGIAARWSQVPVEDPIPLADAVRTGGPVYVPTPEENAHRYPLLAADTDSAGLAATASIALADRRGEPMGAIGFAWSKPQDFGDEQQAILETVARLTSQSLDRVRLTEAEHEIAADLQRRLMPARLNAPRGIALAARYRAGHRSLDVGGDWYEVVARRDGRAVLAIGDIVGHGPEAAAAMGQIRSALTATAEAADGPAQLLDRLEEFAGRAPGVRFSTVCVALLDPRDGSLRYATAGHPPPLLLAPDGSTALLEGARSHPLLAMARGAEPQAPHREEAVAVPPGGRVLLYTDGLIERRDPTADYGFGRLQDAARRNRGEAIEPFCDALLDDLLAEGDGSDDTAVLCVERIGREMDGSRAE